MTKRESGLGDVLAHINATHREIDSHPVTGGPGRSLLLRRTYAYPVEDLWNACTDPQRLGRWLAPVEGELRPGGTFRVVGQACGRVLRCDGPHLLKVTWEYGEGTPTEVELRLSPDGHGGTVFELRHSSAAEAIDELVRTEGPLGAVENGAGWDLTL